MKKTPSRLALIIAVVTLFFTNVPLFASETDDSIETSIKHSYVFKTYVNGDDVKIVAKNGAVALSGTVLEESHKLLAGETVAGTPGVKSFDNKLVVKGEIPAMNSNAWLTSKVKATLWFHRNVNAAETEVIAKDGVVTLRGEASSQAQKDLTTEYAKDVEGVKDVRNEMVAAIGAMKEGEKSMGQNMDAMGETIDDASITGLVKSTLLYHHSTSALKTTVETNGGVVTLGGKAKNGAEKDLAGKIVNEVRGVRMVVNNMTIE